jgi:hypothetical protein
MSSGAVRALMDGAPPNLLIFSLPNFIQRNSTMAVPHHIFLHRNARAEVALDAPKPIELKAGDVFVIEPGFKATSEVVERARKYYVFVLA